MPDHPQRTAATRLSFRQWPGDARDGLPHNGGEAYLLRSIDPAGQSAQVLFGGEFAEPAVPAVGSHAYEARLVQDSGPFTGQAPVIMLVAFDVPEAMREEVDRWYVEEHVPLLLRAPGWMRARRYDVEAMGEGSRRFTSLAFHQLADVSVLDSLERAFARSTEWRARLEHGGTWFGQAGRWVYAGV